MTSVPRLRVADARPLTLGDLLPPNVLLALAILGHRPWCPSCAPHAAHLIAALLGRSITEIARAADGQG